MTLCTFYLPVIKVYRSVTHLKDDRYALGTYILHDLLRKHVPMKLQSNLPFVSSREKRLACVIRECMPPTAISGVSQYV